MDPAKPESFNHCIEKLSTGRTYHFVDQKPNAYDPTLNTTILCVHGFPDFWYGWRYQIRPWVQMGCRVVVPDMLGYGGTDKPTNANEYTTKKLCADLAALLDLLGIERAVLVGHDWGSFTVGRFALWYPNRLLALVMLSVPYTPPSLVYVSLEDVVKKAPNLGYQLYFAARESTTELESNLGNFLNIVFRDPASPLDYTKEGSLKSTLNISQSQFPDLVLTPQEYQYYIEILGKGLNGPLNYYRTTKLRYDEELAAGLPSRARLDLPVLLLWGTRDLTATPSSIRKVSKFIARLQDIALDGKGHWLMVEAKDEVTQHVSQWLRASTIRGRL